MTRLLTLNTSGGVTTHLHNNTNYTRKHQFRIPMHLDAVLSFLNTELAHLCTSVFLSAPRGIHLVWTRCCCHGGAPHEANWTPWHETWDRSCSVGLYWPGQRTSWLAKGHASMAGFVSMLVVAILSSRNVTAMSVLVTVASHFISNTIKHWGCDTAVPTSPMTYPLNVDIKEE